MNRNFMKPSTLVIIASLKCNLNCSYCYISQNPATKEIHEKLLPFLEGNKYLEKISEFYENDLSIVENIEIWGGEPLLGIKNFTNCIQLYVDAMPNLKKIYMPTNMIDKMDELIDFIKAISKTNREIKFEIQMSLDGTEHIVNITRGYNIEQKIRKNFKYLIHRLNEEKLGNTIVQFSVKPTLNMDCLKHLQYYDNLFNYYQYFDDFYNEFVTINKNKNITFSFPFVTTLAVPGQYTQEDGILYSNYVDSAIALSKNNMVKKIFTHYPLNYIFLDSSRFVKDGLIAKRDNKNFGLCGVGKDKIAISPDGKICLCHRGFLDFYPEYRHAAKIKTNTDDKNQKFFENEDMIEIASKITSSEISGASLDRLENDMEMAYNSSRMLMLTSAVANIYELANCGQVSKTYLEDEELLIDSAYVVRGLIPCVYDNSVTTGTLYLRGLSLYRLYCNGALEKIIKFMKEISNELS